MLTLPEFSETMMVVMATILILIVKMDQTLKKKKSKTRMTASILKHKRFKRTLIYYDIHNTMQIER